VGDYFDDAWANNSTVDEPRVNQIGK